MFSFFISLIISILLALGISIALTEKSKEWPIKRYRILLQLFLRKYIHRKKKSTSNILDSEKINLLDAL